MFRSSWDLVRTPVQESTNHLEVFACEMCKSPWFSELELDMHRKAVHIIELLSKAKCKKNYMCLICMRPQESEDDLITHIKIVHLLSSANAQKVERQIYICDYCNGVFFNKFLLTVHIHFRHTERTKNRSVECVLCEKRMLFKNTWFHLNNLHGINDRTTCQICLKKFDTAYSLNDHLRSHAPYFNCTTCNYTTTNETYYVQHLFKHQKPDISLKGLRRNYKYFTKIQKFNNYDIFTGLRGVCLFNFRICILCREICKNDREMKRHVYTMHTTRAVKKQTYMCVCGEQFFNNVLLKHHIFKLKGYHGDARILPYKNIEVIDVSSEKGPYEIEISMNVSETNQTTEVE